MMAAAAQSAEEPTPAAGSRRRLLGWIKAVAVALVAGPPIGGLVFGLELGLTSGFSGGGNWASVPATVMLAVITSYIIGLPVAAVAVVLFLLLSRLVSRGTGVLAVISGVAATAMLIVLNEAVRGPAAAHLRLTWTDFALQLAAFGIPAMIAAWACWRMTRPLHKLS